MKCCRGFILLSFLINSFALQAQNNFAWKEQIGAVDSSGFYSVILSPVTLAKCNADISDLRIRDTDGKEIPFVIDSKTGGAKKIYKRFPVVSKAIHTDKKMHVVVKNTEKFVQHLVLEIQNTDASRTVNISGSNDGKQWFIVKENIPVNISEQTSKGSYPISIDIPPVMYQYFDISFNEKELLPSNILSAGVYIEEEISSAKYDTISTAVIIQKDSSNKRSYILATWNEPYPFEKVKMNVSGTKYYRREVALNNDHGPVGAFVLNSEKPGWMDAAVKSKKLQIQIFNEDNPPLRIDSIQGLIRKRILYAWLEKGKQYNLYFSDSLTRAPIYDLVYFKNLIQQNAPSVQVGSIENNKVTTIIKPSPGLGKKIIWLAMGAILVALLFVTFKVTSEVKNKEEKTTS